MASHSYTFYLYAREAWDAIYSACEKAQHAILFEHYILRDDSIGRPLIELFKQKAREGVRIRMILDAVGSAELLQSSLTSELGKEGIELLFFNSLIPGSLSHYTPWFFRDHRKVVVVDESVGFTGGVCFQEHMEAWRDTCVAIEGPVVRAMTETFEDMLARELKEATSFIPRPLSKESEFAFLTNSPLRKKRYLYYEFIKRINAAERFIQITTPYLVPDHQLIRALRRAKRRGVQLDILLPKTSDNPLVGIGTHSFYGMILSRGARIFEYLPAMSHTKAAVIDGVWGTVGSMNLDHLSLQYNFEANLVTTDQAFVDKLSQQFERDCRDSRLVTEKVWKKRPLKDRFFEHLVWPIRFWL